jgi:hypothetical protein
MGRILGAALAVGAIAGFAALIRRYTRIGPAGAVLLGVLCMFISFLILLAIYGVIEESMRHYR